MSLVDLHFALLDLVFNGGESKHVVEEFCLVFIRGHRIPLQAQFFNCRIQFVTDSHESTKFGITPDRSPTTQSRKPNRAA